MHSLQGHRYKLCALDLDGTLLNSKEEISETNLHSLLKARANGVKIIVTTGRSTPSAQHFIDWINVPDPCITYNGAIIRDEHRIYRSVTIDPGLVKKIVALLKEARYTPVLYSADDMRYLERIEKHRDGFNSLSKGLENRIVQVENLLETRVDDIIRVSIFCDEEDIPHLNKTLGELKGSGVRTTETYFPDLDFWIYEILESQCSKSKGLEYLCNRYKIEPEEVIAIGDNRNDLDMIEWAGLGVAMKNSLPDVLTRADYITRCSNDEDGVSEVIERFILS